MREIYFWMLLTEIGCMGGILFVGLEAIVKRLDIIIDKQEKEGDNR